MYAYRRRCNPDVGTGLKTIKKQKQFKAGDITKFTSAFEILNPDHVICNLDESAHVEVELTIEKGRGYLPAEENKPAEQVFGFIPIDAIFTPVKNVKYSVENTRVEQKTDYEKLVVDIETDDKIKAHPSQVRDYYQQSIKSFFAELKLKCGQYKIDFVEADINEGIDKILWSYVTKRNKMR